MLFFVCLLDDLILGFCCSNLTQETDGLELASTITLVLQYKRTDKPSALVNSLYGQFDLSLYYEK